MEETNIIKLNGNVEKFNLSNALNGKLHEDFKDYYLYKEYKDFLNKYSLEPTIFNLNCLEILKGVILTDTQIKNLKDKEDFINLNN